eukprot:4148524-Amphidinium_carterae.1
MSLVDTRGIAKLPAHDGKEETWGEFEFKFTNYAHLLGWGELIDDYLQQAGDTVVPMARLGELGRNTSRTLFAALAMALSGRSLGILRLVADNHGLEAWRQLKQEYEPHSGNRVAGMLRAILNPQ